LILDRLHGDQRGGAAGARRYRSCSRAAQAWTWTRPGSCSRSHRHRCAWHFASNGDDDSVGIIGQSEQRRHHLLNYLGTARDRSSERSEGAAAPEFGGGLVAGLTKSAHSSVRFDSTFPCSPAEDDYALRASLVVVVASKSCAATPCTDMVNWGCRMLSPIAKEYLNLALTKTYCERQT
jgi:hypothetical protein